MTGGCRWHIKLVQAIFVILSFISFSVHLLFFLHALFLECKFFWTELLLILLNITALSGCLCVFFFSLSGVTCNNVCFVLNTNFTYPERFKELIH